MDELAGWDWHPGAVRVRFSSRRGGVSGGAWSSCNVGAHVGDDLESVLDNRRALAHMLGCTPHHVAAVEQVHGADVWVDLGRTGNALPADVSWARGRSGIDADALVSTRSGIALAVAVADCAPVALCWGAAIAMVHAGWRGIVGGVLEATVAALRRAAGPAVSMAQPPRAVIGPHIGPCCFEVGVDVASQFDEQSVVRSDASRPRIAMFDEIALRLEPHGFVVEQLGPCTACTPQLLFSHRRDGAPTGRQAGLIWMAA